MAEKMTAREALEIISLGWESYSGRRWCRLAATPSLPMLHVESQIAAEWDRARAIIDALVEAHEAYCAWLENGGSDYAHSVAFKKLRAMERGEEAQ